MVKKMSILILGNNHHDAELMERELHKEKLNFTSKRVDNKEDFIEELKSFIPDIILADYSLPQFDGMAALELVKKMDPDIPFIIVTGSINEEVAVDCIKAGAWDYVLKDHLSRLHLAVKNAIKRKKDLDRKSEGEEKIKESLKEKEVMLREIHHRVKNNMQIIISLLRLQAREAKSDEASEMFRKSQSRIMTMALIHEKLYRSENLSEIEFGSYIKILIDHLLSSYAVNPNKFHLETDIKNIFLDINRAIPCGLIINELVTNSITHAFPEDKEGSIKVAMSRTEDDHYMLTVNDDGVGFPEGINIRDARSLGLQLVNDLVLQLHGSIEIERKKGTKYTILF